MYKNKLQCDYEAESETVYYDPVNECVFETYDVYIVTLKTNIYCRH